MRILYIGSFRLPNLDAAAARVLNIARALRKAGHDVSFISWGGMQREEDLCEDGLWRIDGFPYIVTHELPQSRLSIFEQLGNKIQRGKKTKRLLNEWSESIDVIITYNSSICKWLIPFCEKRCIKLINDITEWYSYRELKPTDWLGYAYDMYFRQKKVKNKIVISSYLDRFYNTMHNIVIPATCDASEAKWIDNHEYANSIIAPFNGITLIYAGNPARKDLVHNVINAVQRLATEGASIRFLFIGTTRHRYLSTYGSMLRTRNLHNNIHFIEKVSQDMIPSFYHHADFMVFLREDNRKSNAGFPTKFSEAMIAGTPIIANLTSDIGDYLFDGKTGFVVNSPSEESIYLTLKDKVMYLTRKQIIEMKLNVHQIAKQLDYHAYVEALRVFMDELK